MELEKIRIIRNIRVGDSHCREIKIKERWNINLKKLLLFPLFAFILACQAVTGIPARQNENMNPEPTQTITDSAAPKGITIVRLHKQGGDLSTQLAAEAQKAAALGQQPVAYFDASW
jgi:hypothetical protein